MCIQKAFDLLKHSDYTNYITMAHIVDNGGLQRILRYIEEYLVKIHYLTLELAQVGHLADSHPDRKVILDNIQSSDKSVSSNRMSYIRSYVHQNYTMILSPTETEREVTDRGESDINTQIDAIKAFLQQLPAFQFE